MMFNNKHAALQWRLKKRRELLSRLDRLLREINILDREIEYLHGEDPTMQERLDEIYDPMKIEA